jgi:hypothetical protein
MRHVSASLSFRLTCYIWISTTISSPEQLDTFTDAFRDIAFSCLDFLSIEPYLFWDYCYQGKGGDCSEVKR